MKTTDRTVAKIATTMMRDVVDRLVQALPDETDEMLEWALDRAYDAVVQERAHVKHMRSLLVKHDPMDMKDYEEAMPYGKEAVKIIKSLRVRSIYFINPSITANVVALVMWHSYCHTSNLADGKPCGVLQTYESLRQKDVFDAIGRDIYAWLSGDR